MRQAETAATVYHHDIEPTLTERHRFVRAELAAFIAQMHYPPTALELLRFIMPRYPDRYFDPNSVRPRLHELEEMGSIRHGRKRACDITKKTVWTWVLSRPEKPTQTELF